MRKYNGKAVCVSPGRDFTLSPLSLFIDTLRLAGDEGDRSRRIEFDWEIVGERGLPIRASCGVELLPTKGIGNPEDFDNVVVVGGLLDTNRSLSSDKEAFLLRAAEKGVPLTALCTGKLRAGALRPARWLCAPPSAGSTSRISATSSPT